MKKTLQLLPLLLALAVALIACSPSLEGDDKLALDLLADAAKQFRDPGSVRLISGRIYQGEAFHDYKEGDSQTVLLCVISATNSYNARLQNRYEIYRKVDNTVLVSEIIVPERTSYEVDFQRLRREILTQLAIMCDQTGDLDTTRINSELAKLAK